MKIKLVESKVYRIPLAEPVQAYAAGILDGFDMVIVKITDEDGNIGTGYTALMKKQGLSVKDIIVEVFSDADLIENLWKKMWKKHHYAGRGGTVSFAIAAVDTALWDLKARKLNTPLWKLLGGNNNKILAYSGNIDLNFPIEKLITQASKNINDGYKAIKMRLGRDTLKEDIERVAAVRKHIGDNIELMADANEAWRVDQAIKASNILSEFNLTWLEEPLRPDDYAGYKLLRLKGKVPIAAGENLHTIAEFLQLFQSQGVDFPEPDFTTCGGITPFMKIAKIADAFNLPVMSHGAHEIHLSLLAACPNAAYLEVHAFGIEDYILKPMKMENGYAVAPERPGHGVDFNFEKLKQHIL